MSLDSDDTRAAGVAQWKLIKHRIDQAYSILAGGKKDLMAFRQMVAGNPAFTEADRDLVDAKIAEAKAKFLELFGVTE